MNEQEKQRKTFPDKFVGGVIISWIVLDVLLFMVVDVNPDRAAQALGYGLGAGLTSSLIVWAIEKLTKRSFSVILYTLLCLVVMFILLFVNAAGRLSQ